MIKLELVTEIYWLTESQKEEKKELGTEYTPFPPYLDKVFLEELENFPRLGKNNLKILVKKDINVSDENEIGLIELAKTKSLELKNELGLNKIYFPEEKFYCVYGDRDILYDKKNFRKDIRWALCRTARGLEKKTLPQRFLDEVLSEIYAQFKLKSKNIY